MDDLKEQLKRIKALTSSILVTNPTMQDTTSELISKIGVLTNDSNERQQGNKASKASRPA